MKAVRILTLALLMMTCCAYGEIPSCFKEIEDTFFKEKYVSQAMSMHDVPRGQWVPINDALQSQQPSIRKLVEERAKKRNPNPLDSPFDPVGAREVLMDILYEVFANTMRNNYVFNEGDIRLMFYFIRSKNLPQLKECFGENIPKDWFKEQD